MNRTIAAFAVVVLMSGCGSNDKVDSINKRLAVVESRLDSLIQSGRLDLFVPDSLWQYSWFQLGHDDHQIVNTRFYVTSITAEFKQNGYEVSGVISNLDALAKINVKIECVVKDTSRAGGLATGFTEVSYLIPGIKSSFKVFVPTAQTNVVEIGVRVEQFRM